ncbi:camk camk1 protein kinase [Nannochloropsis oceanica]
MGTCLSCLRLFKRRTEKHPYTPIVNRSQKQQQQEHETSYERRRQSEEGGEGGEEYGRGSAYPPRYQGTAVNGLKGKQRHSPSPNSASFPASVAAAAAAAAAACCSPSPSFSSPFPVRRGSSNSHSSNNSLGGGGREGGGTSRKHRSDSSCSVSSRTPMTSGGGTEGGLGQGSDEGGVCFHVKYELKDVIGVGSTSTVYRCVEKRGEGREFACKIIDKRMVESRFRGLLDQFQLEIGVLRALGGHKNIIHLEDVFETEERIYMVMELMRGGELFDYVVEKGTLSEEEASELVRCLASAIAYMHSLEIIHRDLKPENLLLTHRAEEGGVEGRKAEVKIIDFGLSKILGGAMAKSFLGTRGYLAPEMLQRQTYSKTIDVWALGVIVFVLLCGCLPFDDDSTALSSESVQAKFQLRFPSWANNLSSGAKDLLVHLLDINPRTRFTAEQALAHPWQYYHPQQYHQQQQQPQQQLHHSNGGMNRGHSSSSSMASNHSSSSSSSPYHQPSSSAFYPPAKHHYYHPHPHPQHPQHHLQYQQHLQQPQQQQQQHNYPSSSYSSPPYSSSLSSFSSSFQAYQQPSNAIPVLVPPLAAAGRDGGEGHAYQLQQRQQLHPQHFSHAGAGAAAAAADPPPVPYSSSYRASSSYMTSLSTKGGGEEGEGGRERGRIPTSRKSSR